MPRAIQLLFLTGCRAQEIGDLEWAEIKDNGVAISGERTKNGEPLWLPLTKTALDVLNSVPRVPGEARVFDGEPGRNLVGKNTAVDKRIVRAGGAVPPHWTLHDIRRTVRTNLAKLRVPRDVAERILNHVAARDGLVRTYDRYDYAPEILEALTKWEARLLQIVGAADVRTVLPIVRKSWEHRGQCGKVLAVLKEAGAIMDRADIAAAAGVPVESTGAYLAKMVNAGKIIRTEPGQFLHPDNQPKETAS